VKLPFAGDDVEVAAVQGEDASLKTLRARDDARVCSAERKIALTLRQFTDPGEVVVAGLEAQGAAFEVGKETI